MGKMFVQTGAVQRQSQTHELEYPPIRAFNRLFQVCHTHTSIYKNLEVVALEINQIDKQIINHHKGGSVCPLDREQQLLPI